MLENNSAWGHPALHENVVMPVKDFPIKFFEYFHGSPGPYCGMHWHEQLEMIFVFEGCIETSVGTSSFVSQPDDLILINSNELHSYTLVRTPIHIFVVLVDIGLLQSRFVSSEETKLLTPIAKSNLLFKNHIEGDAQIKSYFQNLMHEQSNHRPGYEFAIKSAVYGIVTTLIRHYIERFVTGHESVLLDKNLRNINRVISYIEENYTENITLSALASASGVTHYYLCRFFKEMTGLSPMEYLNRFRVNKAAAELIHSDTPITKIALSCGFNDSNYFSRVFKEHIGCSPSRYRKNLEVQ